MEKKGYRTFRRWVLVFLNLAAATVLAFGVAKNNQEGYTQEMWKDILKGNSWQDSAEYQRQASDAVYHALEVMARSSRLERGGIFDPERIIRVRDYLESKTVYDVIPENQKGDGICYRLGDLYQWSLKGTNIRENVLQESYRPLFYESIQQYANECDEEYQVVVEQILEAMKLLQKDVAKYQQILKNWSYEAVNVRYALKDLSSGSLYTNVPKLREGSGDSKELEDYFYGFGSYYSFDSRSASVVQQRIGEYYSYNTHALLTGWNAHLEGEYQVYVGIDTDFLVADGFARGARTYEAARGWLAGYGLALGGSALILLCTLFWLFWKLSGAAGKYVAELLSHMHMALRVGVIFGGFVLFQSLLWVFLGKGAVAGFVVFLYELAVLGVLVSEEIQRQKLLEGVQALAEGVQDAKMPEERLFFGNRQMAEAVNQLGEGLQTALQEQMKSERMKAALITNVSHDLKTPLTSIINYVDLMKRERIDSPKIQEYLLVLDEKSQRLKQLTDDLVEASRASSGNVVLDMGKIDLKELLMQTGGEFTERFAVRGLTLLEEYPDHPLYVEADGRHLWRIIENLYRNVEKYAMPYTRVYVDLMEEEERAVLSMKNISEQALNISAEELTERFTRGDESRSTEGSGLGLSIAKDLTELQHGTFAIYLDGDLFKVTMTFPKAGEHLQEAMQ